MKMDNGALSITTILTSKNADASATNRLRDQTHTHCHLEGSMPGWSVRQTVFMEMSAILATALATPEVSQLYQAFATGDEVIPDGGKNTMNWTVADKTEALRVVQKVHRNLSPSHWRHASVGLRCNLPVRSMSAVQKAQQRRSHRVTWFKNLSKKFPPLSVMDTVTKYQTAILLRSLAWSAAGYHISDHRNSC